MIINLILGIIGLVGFFIGIVGWWILYSCIKDRKLPNEIRSKRDLLLYLMAFVLCASYLWYTIYKYENIVPDGTYCHYAIVSSDSGSYTLPARVYKTSDTSEVEMGYDYLSGERRTVGVTTSAYYISEVYWPNGGYLYFEEDVPMIIGEEYTLRDQNWDEWNVIITETRAEHEKITERVEEKDWISYGIDIVVLIGGIAGSFLALISYFKNPD